MQYLLDRQADIVPAVKAGVKYENYPQNSTFSLFKPFPFLICLAMIAHDKKEGSQIFIVLWPYGSLLAFSLFDLSCNDST